MGKYISHIGYFASIKTTYVQISQILAEQKHAPHICYITSVKITNI